MAALDKLVATVYKGMLDAEEAEIRRVEQERGTEFRARRESLARIRAATTPGGRAVLQAVVGKGGSIRAGSRVSPL